MAGIRNLPIADIVPVGISSTGQLGIRPSSARFKEDIHPMAEASNVILHLHPVSFRYHKNLDPKGGPQFGLVAEEVEKIDPDLVAHDATGEPYTVRYDEVNAMLLNEFLKEHDKVEAETQKVRELETTVHALQSAIAHQGELEAAVAQLQRALAEQAGQIQKVDESQAATAGTATP